MVIYNIQNNGPSSQLVIELVSDEVFVEPRSLSYVVGQLEYKANDGEMKKQFQSRLIGNRCIKPSYKGTGYIYLKSTLGNYHKFTLKNGEELIIPANTFIACRDTIKMYPQTNISLAGFLSGTPQINTLVQGPGNLVVLMPGPTLELKLLEDKFMTYGTDVAAYSPNLKLTREFTSKMVRVFRGTGNLYFCPHANKGAIFVKK